VDRKVNPLKRSIPVIVAAAFMFIAVSRSANAAQPIMLFSVINQQSTQAPPPAVPSQTRSKPQFLIGPEASVFFPTSGKAEKYYGKSWSSIGAGLGSAFQATVKGAYAPFFTILYNNHDNNYAFLAPFGVGYSKALTNNASSAYYGADLIVLAADQRAVAYGIHSGFRYGGGARIVAGYEFGKNAYLQASYEETSEVKNVDFSGTGLEAGIRF
jgi:hypothetical protein